MIPDIGLMIGAYILVRMASFLTRKGDRRECLAVKAMAVVCIIATVVCMADLLLQGMPTP